MNFVKVAERKMRRQWAAMRFNMWEMFCLTARARFAHTSLEEALDGQTMRLAFEIEGDLVV